MTARIVTTGRFFDSTDQVTDGQRVEVLVSTDPVELRPGTVSAVDGSVAVEFDDGTAGQFRVFQVRGLPARSPLRAHYTDDAVTLYHGDCIKVLAELPEASVDAVVTDPPYGISFMGRQWDQPGKSGSERGDGRPRGGHANTRGTHDAMAAGSYDLSPAAMANFQRWCTEWATECLRVLKPGGHLVAFGGSRTWHRLAAAIEDAGFEIRDSIAWLYGSGFPKSLDVSKAIDKRRDDESAVRGVCRWLRERIDTHPSETIATVAEKFGFHPRMVEHWAARDTDSQPSLPTLEQWDMLRELLAFDDELDAEVFRLNLRKGEPGESWADRPIVGTVEEWSNRTNYALTSRDGLRRGGSNNPQAKQWQGWGTALKPSFEPIVVARKPLSGTVAANVLEHGTGAFNIDACRIEAHDSQLAEKYASVQNAGARSNTVYGGDSRSREGSAPNDAGRWPTNVVLDQAQAQALDQQSGVSQSRIGSPRGAGAGDGWGMTRTGAEYDDQGGASRFFPVFRYEAKAPTSERPSVDGVAHPTVKPLDLMRWLVRLVTPPHGVVLEPFAGSGTTAEACVHEHMRCIAIERESDYLPLITARLTKPIEVGFDFTA